MCISYNYKYDIPKILYPTVLFVDIFKGSNVAFYNAHAISYISHYKSM